MMQRAIGSPADLSDRQHAAPVAPIGAACDPTRPPWESEDEATRCIGGARLRRLCRLAQWPVAPCGFVSLCQQHSAVVPPKVTLYAERPADSEMLGTVRLANGKMAELYIVPSPDADPAQGEVGKVIGVVAG